MTEDKTPLMRLEIDFQLVPIHVDTHVLGGSGNLSYNDGDAFSRAARWCGIGLDEFLHLAIESRLDEVQAAMEEECAGIEE